MVQPYRFYPCYKLCPRCRTKLVSNTPLTRRFTQGLLHDLGLTCHCVHCNTRYRARSRLPFSKVAWLGSIGRWIWWQTAELEETLVFSPEME